MDGINNGIYQQKKGRQSSPIVNGYTNVTHRKYTIKERYIKVLSGETPKTHLMVCTELKITPSSYTALKRKLENTGQLFELYQAPCKVSGNNVWYLTTNLAIALKHGITPEKNAANINKRITWIKGKFSKAEPTPHNSKTKLF